MCSCKVKGCKKHCEKFPFIHCDSPRLLHAQLDSAVTWTVHGVCFIAVSCGGWSVPRVDQGRRCKINSVLSPTPKPLLTKVSCVHAAAPLAKASLGHDASQG